METSNNMDVENRIPPQLIPLLRPQQRRLDQSPRSFSARLISCTPVAAAAAAAAAAGTATDANEAALALAQQTTPLQVCGSSRYP